MHLDYVEASIRKNQNQLTMTEVDIKFLTVKRRRLLLGANPLEEQKAAQQLRDKEAMKEALEDNLRVLQELKEDYSPKLVA